MKTTQELLSELTIGEKISLLAGKDLWHTNPIPRLGIPAIKVTDGPNGARGAGRYGELTAACFPVGTALAATWNPELVERVGQALGEETRSKGAHILLAPTVNIHRSPLAGRNFECYSEDPHLTSRMGVAYIKGVQSQGVGACIKHFVCNDSEFERFTISSEVGERALREIYLPPFLAAIREADPWSLMSAYNKLNGVYCSENQRLLLNILKGEWDYQGLVVSDWYGTYSFNAVAGGLDLEMPGPVHWMGPQIEEAVETGEISLEVVDDKIRRLLETMRKVGAFENPELGPEREVNNPEHRLVAREVAGEAIVLLKNEGPVLPLNQNEIKTIAVIGENARWAQIQGGGSAYVPPHYSISPMEGVRAKAGPDIRVDYEIGCSTHRMLPLLESEWLQGSDGAGPGLVATYFANPELSGEAVHSGRTTTSQMDWFGYAMNFVDPRSFSARLQGQFTPPESGVYTLGLASLGRSRFYLDGELTIDRWDEPESWDETEKTTPVELVGGQTYDIQLDFSWEGSDRHRGVRLGCLPPLPENLMERAVALAARADAAIVVAGLTPEWEGEGFDRVDMELPGDQNELIERVAAANPNTVVVLNNGSPLALPWLDRVPAVLQAWYGGQELGSGIADVLFGEVNPSGRLPQTWPLRLEDNPAYINYPGENGQVLYGEGIFVGYRYYDKKQIEPLFPFGYGLSYTTFNYSNLVLAKNDISPEEGIEIRVDVQNTGARSGKEVVQLYVQDSESTLMRPEKELKAFKKIELDPGETKTVTFNLGPESLAFYDPARQGWIAEEGGFIVFVGSSAKTIHLEAHFHLLETVRV
jgi:beta-glucosidase